LGLAQQLVGAGEKVVDVPPKLAARARLLDNGETNKNDPNDARSVAVAALRAKRLSEVTKEDHAAVMRLWARRRKDLTSSRTRVANRLHAVILELVPGGYAGEIYANKVARLRSHFAAYNGSAPIEVSSGPKKLYRLSMRGSTWQPSPRCATPTARAVPTTTARSPRERHTRRPCGRSNAASATPYMPPWWPMPVVSARRSAPQAAREGKRGAAQ
jgi:hypothetical protein